MNTSLEAPWRPTISLALVTRAIAHPGRLRILEILGQGEACVCHLTHALGARQPYVSQQLMRLREAAWCRTGATA